MQPATNTVSLACWHAGGMTSHSRDALPVLEEWYDREVNGRRPCNRPLMCGVAGCAEPLVKAYHLDHRLCPAHMRCHAVLRRGVPQRWCGTCHVFHALEAFRSGRRYAPTSRGERCAHTQTGSPRHRCKHPLGIAGYSSQLEYSALLQDILVSSSAALCCKVHNSVHALTWGS